MVTIILLSMNIEDNNKLFEIHAYAWILNRHSIDGKWSNCIYKPRLYGRTTGQVDRPCSILHFLSIRESSRIWRTTGRHHYALHRSGRYSQVQCFHKGKLQNLKYLLGMILLQMPSTSS